MAEKIITELVTAVGYIRMSSDQQTDSPERQRRQIEEYAGRNAYRIIKWYSDHGMTGTESKRRASYQQLLADAPSGLFAAVLITEQSRMSREDLFSVFPQWGVLKDAGVQIVSCQSGPIDFSSLGGLIQAIVGQYGAHDEARKIADRTVTGKISKALRGERIGGNRLFGYDRNIVDHAGNVMKRVSFREQFIKSVDCHSVLVPSAESEAVDAVKWAFDHILNGGSVCGVTREFNRRGLVGIQGKEFYPSSVKLILTNPTYAGLTRSGFFCSGKFRRMSDSHSPITMEDTHAPLVDRQTFETVAAMIETRSVSKDTWKTYLLSGLCRCGHCGMRLTGQWYKGQAYRYSCYKNQGVKKTPCDEHPSFDGPMLEVAVVRAWCDVYLHHDVGDQLKMKPPETHSEHEQRELKTLGEQIARAENNLALCDADEFKTVSGVLSQLRKRETGLRDKLTRTNRKMADLAPDILAAVERVRMFKDVLRKWPNVGTQEEHDEILQMLSVVMKKTISDITLRVNAEPIEQCAYHTRGSILKRRTGVIAFNQDHISAPDAILTDEMLAHPFRRKYRTIGVMLKEAGKPLAIGEIAKLMKVTDYKSALRALHLCRREGLVEMVGAGPSSRWQACG